jgi:hypothetical protein
MKNSAVAWRIGATLFAVSWSWTLPAAEEIGKKPATVSVVVELERFPANSWTLPNGKTIAGGGAMCEMITCDAGKVKEAVAAAKRRHAEMKELIAQKRHYRLVKVWGEEKFGGKIYNYSFAFSDGSQKILDFTIPLHNVASWDDYVQKRQAEEDERHEKINRAIVAGSYRLKHVETRYSFVCQDAGSTEKCRVLFMPAPKGKHRAQILPFEANAEEHANTTLSTTSWQDHLQAVRKGKRKVLSQETRKTYYYEMFLEDGSKTMFPSSEPL